LPGWIGTEICIHLGSAALTSLWAAVALISPDVSLIDGPKAGGSGKPSVMARSPSLAGSIRSAIAA
jgi:hypothetical protein